MVTSKLKNKIDRLWEMFWTGRMLDIPYASIISDQECLKRSVLRDKPAETLYQTMMGEKP